MVKTNKYKKKKILTFWKRETMSPAMVLTRAVMSSMKRSGKRFFLGDSSRSVKYKWCMMLLTWNEKGSRTHCSSHNLNSRCYTFDHKGGSMETYGCGSSYHELKEEPSLLQGSLPHAATADHPLQGKLLMKELSTGRNHQRTIHHQIHFIQVTVS